VFRLPQAQYVEQPSPARQRRRQRAHDHNPRRRQAVACFRLLSPAVACFRLLWRSRIEGSRVDAIAINEPFFFGTLFIYF
jgi:hypothetical protein